jgi:predicted DNA-binding transcriptional regulator YafY
MDKMGPATSFGGLLMEQRQFSDRLGLDQVLPPWLVASLKNRNVVKIRYVTREGETFEREVEPREVKIFGEQAYLVAVCRASGEEKKIRLDRILEVVDNIE